MQGGTSCGRPEGSRPHNNTRIGRVRDTRIYVGCTLAIIVILIGRSNLMPKRNRISTWAVSGLSRGGVRSVCEWLRSARSAIKLSLSLAPSAKIYSLCFSTRQEALS